MCQLKFEFKKFKNITVCRYGKKCEDGLQISEYLEMLRLFLLLKLYLFLIVNS